MNTDKTSSSRLRLEFSGREFAEIGGCGSFEALVGVDDGVDLVIRKREAVPGWEVLQASHFTEFQEGEYDSPSIRSQAACPAI